MSGILDNRTRIMDTIVTLEGRRQMADGKLRVEYVSFTDGGTFYDPDVISGSADATKRIYFEQCHLPQDQITFEADDSGRLKPFKNSKGINTTIAGKLYENYSSSANFEFLTDSAFASAAETLIASSVNNFNNLQVIGTKDYVFENDGFDIGPNSVTFEITNEKPVSVQNPDLTNRFLNELPSLFNDKLLSNVLNFKYLPPVNKIENTLIDKTDLAVIEANKIGNYEKLGTDPFTPQQLETELSTYEKSGYKKLVKFDPTSMKNRLVSQFFEIDNTEMKKLDVIDYGTYQYNGVQKQAFFVGKVFLDSNGSQTFVRLFTLVFE